MKKTKKPLSYVVMRKVLLFGLLVTPLVAKDYLPQSPFPLGREDLAETRTVTQLRPGLTHIRVERGGWPKEGPPKMSLVSNIVSDKTELAPFRDCLLQAGYAVREHQFLEMQATGPQQWYWISAGSFDSADEARSAAVKLPCPVQVTNPSLFPNIATAANRPDWDVGPWIVNIVIVDPKVYRGKVVSAWSGRSWRESPLELARKHNAVVATNGSFFEYSEDEIAGIPTGVSIVQGEWHHESREEGSWGGIVFLDNTPDGATLSIVANGEAPPLPEFKWIGKDGSQKSLKLDGIDRMPKDDDIVAMRPMLPNTSPLSHATPKHILLTQIGAGGYLTPGLVPFAQGLVVMATGTKKAVLEEALASKQPVTLDLRVLGRPGLNAWLAAPPLVKDGEPGGWGLSPWGRATRTAIGADAEGKIYLIGVDGAASLYVMPTKAIGVTLVELQRMAQFLGLVNAANLDGGGRSTSMVIEGRELSSDSDIYLTTEYDDDRRVGDAVLIIDDDA